MALVRGASSFTEPAVKCSIENLIYGGWGRELENLGKFATNATEMVREDEGRLEGRY